MMIGPAPMIRMLLMSVRLGMLFGLHQFDEAVKEVGNIVWPWRRFWVTLETERGLVGAGQTLQGAIKQADVGGTQVGRQSLLVDGKAMVLTGDGDPATVEVLDRMVGAVVAKLHLEGLGTGGQRHDLMPKANAEDWDAGLNQLTGRRDGIVARLGIPRAIGQEDAVWLKRQHR